MRKIRKIEPTVPNIPKRKRVAAYARVSMETDRLSHSLSAQISYYSDLIQKNPEWEYAGVYADSFVSGTGTERRAEFRRMIDDCEAGRIDIVLCKSISRFARNTLDLLETVRRLKELGIAVHFEKENINSLFGDGELMLTILASFAQEESRSISENVKWGIRKRFEKGDPCSRNPILGYEWVDGVLVIVPEEAAIVKRIFQNFLDGKSRLETEREPVVFDMVQMELERRSSGGRYSGVSIFSSKVKCGQCGGWYGAKVWHSTDKYRKVIYRCNHKYGEEKCHTPHITEDEIKAAFVKAVNQLLENRTEIAENVSIIKKAICDTSSLETDKDRLFEEMSMLSDLIQSLIDENARVVMNQEDYNRRFEALSKQYEMAKQRYEQVQRQIQELAVRGQQLGQFQRQVFELGAVTEFDDALWGTLVDFITVTADGEKIVTFRGGTEITV